MINYNTRVLILVGSAKKFTMQDGCPNTCVVTAIRNYTSILEKEEVNYCCSIANI